jgi:hypothetical protein
VNRLAEAQLATNDTVREWADEARLHTDERFNALIDAGNANAAVPDADVLALAAAEGRIRRNPTD